MGPTGAQCTNKIRTLRRRDEDSNLSELQFLTLARKELTMPSLSSSKDFNVAIVGGGMCGLAW